MRFLATGKNNNDEKYLFEFLSETTLAYADLHGIPEADWPTVVLLDTTTAERGIRARVEEHYNLTPYTPPPPPDLADFDDFYVATGG